MNHSISSRHLLLLKNAPLNVMKLVADKNYTLFFFGNGSQELMAYSLKKYQDYFEYPFVRVSRSCMVNLKYVKKIDISEKKVLMKDGSELRISRRKMPEVLKCVSVNISNT